MDFWRKSLHFIENNPGKMLGALLGLLWGLVVLWLGLFWAVFLTGTTLAGYWFGKKIDDREELLEIFHEWLRQGR